MSFYYKYKRIDLATDAIRLLRLFKGCRDDTIQCELFESYLHLYSEGATAASGVPVDAVKDHVLMGEPLGVPYEALSYTWGSNVSDDRIWLGIQQVEVTENLYCALKNLRHAEQDRILWIDALCIDQTHQTEKSHQVAQMRLIYQNAQNVIIWLGSGNFRTKHLFAQMSSLDRRVIRRPRPRTLTMWKDEWEQMSIQPDAYGVPFDLKEALQDLLDREWFERVWTIQEAAMARSARIACGQDQVHSRTFTMMPELLNVVPTADQQARLDIMPGIRRETSWFSRLQDTKFLTLLERFRSSKATIPHDTIYALVGICKEAYNSPRMVPDYTLNQTQVVKNTLIFLLNESDDVENRPNYYYGDYPDWGCRDLLDALRDLHLSLYTWAQQHYEQNLMFAILSAEKATGNISGFERLAMIPGGLAVAVMKNHPSLIDMFLELPKIDTVVEGRLEIQLWHMALARHDDDQAAKLLSVYVQNHGLVPCVAVDAAADLVSCRKYGQVLELLLPYCCNSLQVSASLGREDLLESILIRNPALLGQGQAGHMSLRTVASKGYEGSVKFLLAYGANVEFKDHDDGTTPLWAAAQGGYSNCVELLLNHGADIEAKRSNDNATPLWVAANGGCLECVELLLRYGASTDVRAGGSGITPLETASRCGYTRCAEVIRTWPQNRSENTEFELH